MKAAICSNYGPHEVLQIQEVHIFVNRISDIEFHATLYKSPKRYEQV